ncbi:MAG: hypothetical protein P4L76_04035 [Beijerinckiaceae bacterium]|nr:hypothetical protein [Beijerinckiaceae bacterium]
MTRYAKTTEVSVEKSRAEIETIVRLYGADSFLSGWDGDRAMVQFRCGGRFVRFRMITPSRWEKRFTEYKQGSITFERSGPAAEKLWEQGCRQRWRALVLLVKAKLEAVESGIVTFEEEFLAHILMPNGATVYETVKEEVALTYETGTFRPLLGKPEREGP